jgi:NADH-quinone oxidoreductase subunit M
MSHYYLSLILFTPLAGALILLLVNKENVSAIKWIANAVALAGFLISVPLWFQYNPGSGEFQFIERLPWIPSIGAEYFLGVDGLSALLILLTTDGIHRDPVVVGRDHRARQGLHIFLLVLQTGMFGAFTGARLPAVLPVLGRDAGAPMYFLIGIWGARTACTRRSSSSSTPWSAAS